MNKSIRIAMNIMADYKYVYDPNHDDRPDGMWNRTNSGWSQSNGETSPSRNVIQQNAPAKKDAPKTDSATSVKEERQLLSLFGKITRMGSRTMPMSLFARIHRMGNRPTLRTIPCLMKAPTMGSSPMRKARKRRSRRRSTMATSWRRLQMMTCLTMPTRASILTQTCTTSALSNSTPS